MSTFFKNWLFVSLYYHQYELGFLLDKGILPFIKDMKKRGKVNSYLLHLGNYRGSYIGLSLKKSKDIELENIGLEVNQFFSDYFDRNPSLNCPEEFNSHNIFENFPNNSIHYNLYNLGLSESIKSTRRRKAWLLNKMSEIMIMALGNETTDEIMIFTYGCYLHVVLLQTLMKSLPAATDFLEYKILTDTSSKEDEKGKNGTHITLKDVPTLTNKDTIMEIIKDIWFRKVYQHDTSMHWMIDLMKIYSSDISRINRTKSENENVATVNLIEDYNWIRDVVRTQLGMSYEAELFLIDYLICGMKNILKERHTGY